MIQQHNPDDTTDETPDDTTDETPDDTTDDNPDDTTDETPDDTTDETPDDTTDDNPDDTTDETEDICEASPAASVVSYGYNKVLDNMDTEVAPTGRPIQVGYQLVGII